MSEVWKFLTNHVPEQQLMMPRGTQLLSVQMQRGVLTLWGLVDPIQPKELRAVYIVGTGHTFDANGKTYLGMVLTDSDTFVWHVFYGDVP